MKFKTVLTLALPLLGMGAVAAQTSSFLSGDEVKQTRMRQHRVVAAAPNTTARAWMVRDRGDLPLGLVSFNVAAPETFTSLFTLPDKVFAGVNTPSGYYFYRFREDTANETMIPLAWSSLDPATGEITDIADWKDKAFIFNDMAYDYKSGKIYGLSREYYTDEYLTALSFEYSGLYTIDASTGVATQVKQFINWDTGALANPTYITLTADLEGNLYAIDVNGYLVKFDRDNDYAEVEIGFTGHYPAQRLQTMTYDPMTGKIYWAADYKSALAELLMVDPETAETQVIGLLGNDARLAGLDIPCTIPSGGAPAAVTEMTVTPSASGENSAQISFVNPTKTFGNSKLASLTKVTIARDGSEIHSVSPANIGETVNYTDQVSEAGYRTYVVTPYNALGTGMAKSVTKWVGHDVPDAPGNVGIGRSDDGAGVIEWVEPTVGLHGGWIDASSLRYRIVRMPGNTLVAEDVKGNTFTDHTVTSMGSYYYVITPYTADGDGAAAKSVTIELGSEISVLPYNCLFENESVFNTWTVINNNGGSTWQWKKRGLSDYDCFAMYQYDSKNDGDDYLVSPPVRMKAGQTYSVKFNYRGSNASHTEKFDVRFGNAATVEGLTNSLKSYELKDGDGRFDTIDLPEITEDGTYYIAFHATSEKNMYNIYITDVTISCTSSGGGTGGGDEDSFKAPTNLKATVNAEYGDVVLSWAYGNTGGETGDDDPGLSVEILEDWEGYPSFILNPTATTWDWSYIDGDKGIPYVSDYEADAYPTDGKPLAAMIMAPYELTKDVYYPNPPHSGDKYLLFKSNFYDGNSQRPAPAPDDYFISPKLNYSSDFVFSFWCKADPDLEGQESGGLWGSTLWNTEQFRVGYSTTGKEASDFIWLTDEPEVITSMDNSWTFKEYAIPAAAKYVCINYCTKDYNGFWFMVDDISIAMPNAGKPRRVAPTFSNFDVYVDGSKVASTEATSYTVTGLEEGDHTASVVAVYAEGESEPATVNFNIKLGGVDEIAAQGIRIYPNPATDVVNFGTAVDTAELLDMSGRCVAKVQDAAAMNLNGIAPGIYLVRMTVAGNVHTSRLIVK